MPTTRPRHQVTETDELATALDRAARRWPHLGRAQLVARLALEGDKAMTSDVDRRRHAIAEHAGTATGTYDRGYLAGLRDEWPA